MKAYYQKDTPLTDNEAAILDGLKKWRLGLSKQLGLKAFIIAWDTDLIALAKIKPSSAEELLSINNFKQSKPYIAENAESILKIINSKTNKETNSKQTGANKNQNIEKKQNKIKKSPSEKDLKILYHLEYFKKIIEYGFFKEWITVNPVQACDIPLTDLRSFLRINKNENGKELSDDANNFSRFYFLNILKIKNRNVKYNPDYKKFTSFLKSEYPAILNNYGYIGQSSSFLTDASRIYSELKETDKNKEITNMFEYYLLAKDLNFYPLLYKNYESKKNDYAAPVIITAELDYSRYYDNKKVMIKFSELPAVSPYNLYIDDDIERASNHLMLCKEEDWSNILNAEIFGNKDTVIEDDDIKDAGRWNRLIDFLMDHAENPLLNTGLVKQNYSLITDKEDQITILRDSYNSFIKFIRNGGDNGKIDYGLLERYIKKPDQESYAEKLKKETNYEKLKNSLFDEKEPSFTGQIKFHGKPHDMYTLNVEQKIFLHCLKNYNDDIIALNGPPGTGKTTILQSLVATKIVDSTLNNEDMPVFFGASFTNQAKNNIIGGFKIDAIETDGSTEDTGNPTKRWLQKIDGKTIDYGCVTKRNEKSEREGLLDLQELEASALKEEWLNESEEFYMKNFSKMSAVNFANELNVFGNIPNFEFNPGQKSTLQDAVKLLKSSVKKIYDSYLLPLESKKQNILNLKTIQHEAAILNQEIKSLENLLNSHAQQIAQCNKKQKDKNDFIQFWSQYTEKYPVIKKILPFLQNELELHRIYDDNKNKYPDIKEIIVEPAKYRIKSIKESINKIINDKSIEKEKSRLNLESDNITSKIKQKQYELGSLNKIIDEIKQIIIKSNGKLNALLKDDVSDEELIHIYNYLGAIIDNSIKYRLFHLSMRANEGEFIIQARKLMDDSCVNNEKRFKKSFDGVTKKYKLFALITPCFVSTMHAIYKTLTYYIGSGSNTEYPLSSFIDYLLVDEAGQCSPEIGALSFLFAKRAVIVGDTYQIYPIYTVSGHLDYSLYRHIVKSENNISEAEFESLPFNCHDYGGSVMKIAQNNSNFWEFPDLERGLYLMEHRRCPKEIIEFSNKLMYKGKLRYPDNWEFKNMVKDKIFEKQEPWNFINVNGQCKYVNKSRINEAEIGAITQWIKDNYEYLDPVEKTVAIITPFKAQAYAIQTRIKDSVDNGDKVTIGTVHALQGAEQKIILFSMTYDKESAGEFLFIDKHKNIINVAVSRTKQSFYVFGEKELFLKAKEGTATRLLGKYLSIAN